jgi:magnesium-protoporphyrin O-methyltransferase
MFALQQKPFTAQAPRGVASRPQPARVATAAVQPRVADAACLAGVLATVAPAAQAAELMQQAASLDTSSLTFAVGSGAAIAGLGALLVATDPQNRCVNAMLRRIGWAAQRIS